MALHLASEWIWSIALGQLGNGPFRTTWNLSDSSVLLYCSFYTSPWLLMWCLIFLLKKYSKYRIIWNENLAVSYNKSSRDWALLPVYDTILCLFLFCMYSVDLSSKIKNWTKHFFAHPFNLELHLIASDPQCQIKVDLDLCIS